MSAIDTQNAKQIRDPMDVLITLRLDNTEIDMSYSGYSSTAKVADGVLDEKSWPMRGLADLQEDGFPLDGSCVLYDSTTSPSQANGKLGVRGNVGQSVSVTATGDGTIASIGINVTGAASVTLNGETTEITGSAVSLQLLDTTAALTFAPASETARIEIINIFPETDFYITNENLIKATVSLRSDLSIIDPTLPESELNVEVYHDLDISEAVASIPDDTPITYQAGYPGDMSPERKFYVSGQVTWADNVLTIHAVDAVHFLEKETLPSLSVNGYGSGRYALGATLGGIKNLVFGLLKYLKIDFDYAYRTFSEFHVGQFPILEAPNSVFFRGETARSLLSKFNNLLHIDEIPPEYFVTSDRDNFWFNYVDAGIPRLTGEKPTATTTIFESDCGGYIQHIEKKIEALYVRNKSADYTGLGSAGTSSVYSSDIEVGTLDWVYGEGAFLNFDADLIPCYMFGLSRKDGGVPGTSDKNIEAIVPADSTGYTAVETPSISSESHLLVGWLLTGPDTEQRAWAFDIVNYTQVVPWGAKYDQRGALWPWRTMEAAWNALKARGTIPQESTTTQLKIYGSKVNLVEAPELYPSTATREPTVIENGWIGKLCFCDATGTSFNTEEAMPKRGYESLLKRSNITCSFTWKGDPRIQPRDVFTFERLDGTEEDWTFENITLTHEKGGTVAEVTARKGIV